VGYIFLSYSRKDKGIAGQLESQLKAAGYEMWIDVEGIRGGDLWREAIVKAIDQADALLALLSPNSVKSDNVCTELVLATENKTRIVPVDISTPPISIPSRMRYLLAGKQRVKYPTEFEKLLEALGSVSVEAQQAVSARGERLPWLGIGLAAVALMIAVGAIGLLVSQSSNGGPQGGTGTTESEAGQTAMVVVKAIPTTVTPTDTPTAAATPSGTPTPTDTPTAAATPSGTPTPADTPTATPTATPCSAPAEYKAGDYFECIRQELGADNIRLGDPKDEEIPRDFAVQKFENGVMYWWDNPEGSGYIWVLVESPPDSRGGTRWDRYEDGWKEGDKDLTCDEAVKRGGPIRGFGKVWCEQKLWNDLGAYKSPEQGSKRDPERYVRIQFFQGGVMLYNRLDEEVYVLFNQKEWRKLKFLH
jgi:cell division septation protein DedD